MNETNDTPEPELIYFSLYFRGMEKRDCPVYRTTADVLATIAADWQRSRPATPLATAIQRDTSPQVYQVFSAHGMQQCALMFRLEDVLYIG